jgi:hypothetical protein
MATPNGMTTAELDDKLRPAGHRARTGSRRHFGRWHEILHWLHEPADWGRKNKYEIRHPLGHRIHLIPGSLLDRACTRAERKKR